MGEISRKKVQGREMPVSSVGIVYYGKTGNRVLTIVQTVMFKLQCIKQKCKATFRSDSDVSVANTTYTVSQNTASTKDF